MQVMTKDTLEIEITSKCTLACPACSRVNTKEMRAKWDTGDLPLELLERVIKDTTFKEYILVGCYGDCIYHPQFWDVMRLLVDNDKNFMVHTNGSSRSRKWWEQSYDIKFKNSFTNRFYFSIDGLADTNHFYRINAKWKTIETALDVMSNHPSKPDLRWRWLDFEYNRHQQDEARKFAESLGIKFEVYDSFRSQDQYKHATPEIFTAAVH
jgi:MoaA/NifB/PqqE/SkfB family radical SAM enzyme